MKDDLHIDQHISQAYNQELQNLRQRAIDMGRAVERQCRAALEALTQGDANLAQEVASSDHHINTMEMDIDAACTGILARRQPTASDLRLILTIVRMIADLERIGDEAEKIGRLALKLAKTHNRDGFHAEPHHIGRRVLEMLSGALGAFEQLDLHAAIAVASRDPDIDQEFEALNRLSISHMMEDPRDVKNVLQVNWCARAMERIGDHAVNICEYVVYLVKGTNVRHRNLQQLQNELLADS